MSYPDASVTMWLSSSSQLTPWEESPLSPTSAHISLPRTANCHPGGTAASLVVGNSAEPPLLSTPERRAKPGQSSHMVRMSRPLFLDWAWRPLCSPSQSLPLTYGPEGWILQWKGTCRQQTALHCPFDFPQAPLRGRHTLSQVPNKGHEKASAVQLPEKQGTDQSRRGPTSAVTKARTSYPESETFIVYLCSYFWNSSKGVYMSGST
eukprot:XP_016859586.1 uncharacterized protein C2orf91 isoform X1 [Homo sapiens]